MYKLVISILMIPVLLLLLGFQRDVEQAGQLYFLVKQAINRSVHAASMQLDMTSWSEGKIVLDEGRAKSTLITHLQSNLLLDEQLFPTSKSRLKEQIKLAEIVFIDQTFSFPFKYHSKWGDEVVFNKPGIFVVCEVTYPRLFKVVSPIKWYIRCASQVVPLQSP